MSEKTLTELAKAMRGIDHAMLTTHTEGGEIAARPMSNNGEVDFDGTSHYFTWEKSRMVSDIEADPNVVLAFQDGKSFYASVTGDASVIRDREEFKAHWTPGLDDWFENGAETEGVVMLRVKATRVKYWDGMEDGELTL